jgi:hypothetical protein
MIHTLHIDDSNPQAKAFLEFIKTLDFVKEEQANDEELTHALEEAIESLEKEGSTPHEEVMAKMKSKYPKFFRA